MSYVLDRSRDAILVARLHAKTMARALAWEAGQHAGRYHVMLGEFLVEIGEGAAGEPEVLVCAPDGRALEILTPELMVEGGPEMVEVRRRVFAETYDGARRIALGVEEAIDSLITALAG